MRALLVNDMEEDFCGQQAALPVPEPEKISKCINKWIEEFRKTGEPIIFVCDTHSPTDTEFSVWPPHCVEGTGGTRIIEGVDYRDDPIIPKTRYSAFFKTSLEKVLRERDVDTLVLTGVCTDICILFTAADAYFRGFEVIVPRDCVKSLDEERHEWALNHMKSILNVKIV
jgi:nicotinamidase/pyrazinamidase